MILNGNMIKKTWSWSSKEIKYTWKLIRESNKKTQNRIFKWWLAEGVPEYQKISGKSNYLPFWPLLYLDISYCLYQIRRAKFYVKNNNSSSKDRKKVTIMGTISTAVNFSKKRHFLFHSLFVIIHLLQSWNCNFLFNPI